MYVEELSGCFSLSSVAVTRLFTLQQRLRELLVFSKKIVILALCLKKHNSLKSEEKIQLQNVLLFCKHFNDTLRQFSGIGLHFVVIHTFITQLSPLQVSYSSTHSELTPMEKVLSNNCS